MADARFFEGISSWSAFWAAMDILSQKEKASGKETEKGDTFKLLVVAFLRTRPVYRIAFHIYVGT